MSVQWGDKRGQLSPVLLPLRDKLPIGGGHQHDLGGGSPPSACKRPQRLRQDWSWSSCQNLELTLSHLRMEHTPLQPYSVTYFWGDTTVHPGRWHGGDAVGHTSPQRHHVCVCSIIHPQRSRTTRQRGGSPAGRRTIVNSLTNGSALASVSSLRTTQTNHHHALHPWTTFFALKADRRTGKNDGRS